MARSRSAPSARRRFIARRCARGGRDVPLVNHPTWRDRRLDRIGLDRVWMYRIRSIPDSAFTASGTHGAHPLRGVIRDFDVTHRARDKMYASIFEHDFATVSSAEGDLSSPERRVLRGRGRHELTSKIFKVHPGRMNPASVTGYFPLQKGTSPLPSASRTDRDPAVFRPLRRCSPARAPRASAPRWRMSVDGPPRASDRARSTWGAVSAQPGRRRAREGYSPPQDRWFSEDFSLSRSVELRRCRAGCRSYRQNRPHQFRQRRSKPSCARSRYLVVLAFRAARMPRSLPCAASFEFWLRAGLR